MKFNTKYDACRQWVNSFNAIPSSVVDKLWEYSGYDDFNEITPYTEEEIEEIYDTFPMWGTMWSFGDIVDEWWLENNLEVMKECGFRIYESEDYGYVFGIDGAGYDFYEIHWIPLYNARGLRWHKE